MEITPVVTPDLYVAMLVLYIATVFARDVVRSVARARRPRVTLRRLGQR